MGISLFSLLFSCVNMGMEITVAKLETTQLNMLINRCLGILEELLAKVRGLETD